MTSNPFTVLYRHDNHHMRSIATQDGLAFVAAVGCDFNDPGGVHIFDLETGRPVALLSAPQLDSPPSRIAVSRDHIYTADGRGGLATWDRASKAVLEYTEPDAEGGRIPIVFEDRLHYGTYRGRLVDPTRGDTFQVRKNLGSAAADAAYLYGGYSDGKVRAFRRQSTGRPKIFRLGRNRSAMVTLSEDHLLCGVREPYEVVVFQRTGDDFEEVSRFDTPHGYTMGLRAFGPHAVWHSNEKVAIYDWRTGEELRMLSIAPERADDAMELCEDACLVGTRLLVATGEEVRCYEVL